jgi:hypothetical protein
MKIIKETSGLMIIKDRSVFAFVVGSIFVSVGILVIFKLTIFKDQPPLWAGIFSAIAGGFVILINKITTITLNKTSNELSFLRKGLSGSNTKRHKLDEIKSVELITGYNTSNSRTCCSYNLVFVSKNNDIIPLKRGSSTKIVMGKQIVSERKIGPKIANFLNVPFEERRPPTARELLSTISSAIRDSSKNKGEKRGQEPF